MGQIILRKVLGNKKKKNKDWGFTRGFVYKKDRVYILSVIEELEEQREHVTQVLRWDGSWSQYMVEWATGAILGLDKPYPQILTMGLGGRIHVATTLGFSEEDIDVSKEGPPYRGILRDMRLIGDHIYVTGMGRQVYRRLSPGQWERFDQGVLVPKGSLKGTGFNSIDGFSENEIYAAGWKGEIWHFDATVWRQIETPTNLIIERVLCVPTGQVYMCGQRGILLRGRYNTWEVISQQITRDDFWGMEWYQNKLWLATLTEIYILENDELNLVDMGKGAPLSCGWLSVNDGVIWSIGSEDLAYFDGKQWYEVILE